LKTRIEILFDRFYVPSRFHQFENVKSVGVGGDLGDVQGTCRADYFSAQRTDQKERALQFLSKISNGYQFI